MYSRGPLVGCDLGTRHTRCKIVTMMGLELNTIDKGLYNKFPQFGFVDFRFYNTRKA